MAHAVGESGIQPRSVAFDSNEPATKNTRKELLKSKLQKYFDEKYSVQEFQAILSLIIIGLAIWGGLYLAIGSPFWVGGPCWALGLVFVFAHVGGFVFEKLYMPSILGQLLFGCLLVNLPGELVADLPATWSKAIRSACLCTIFLRSGLELDLGIFKRVGPVAARLCAIPGIVEALVTGGVAIPIFGMYWALAFSLGFILKAVGPAIVITTMFDLQRRGLGVAKSIPSIVVGAASFDDIVAITGYSIFISIAVPSGGTAYGIAKGPLNIVLGIAGGVILAAACSLTKLWDSKWKRSTVVFFSAMLLMFFLLEYDYSAGGALGGLVLGLVVSQMWEKGWPRAFSLGPHDSFSHDVEIHVGAAWRVLGQPLLFGLIGLTMNSNVLAGSTIPKSLAIIAIGLAARIPATWVITAGAGLSMRERGFLAMAWTPKATVQAALAAAPLDLILQYKRDEPNFAEWVTWGEEILTTAIFSIIVCAPLGTVLINFFAPRWLTQLEMTEEMQQMGIKYVHDPAVVFKTIAAREDQRRFGAPLGPVPAPGQGHSPDPSAHLPLPSRAKSLPAPGPNGARSVRTEEGDAFDDQLLRLNDPDIAEQLASISGDISALTQHAKERGAGESARWRGGEVEALAGDLRDKVRVLKQKLAAQVNLGDDNHRVLNAAVERFVAMQSRQPPDAALLGALAAQPASQDIESAFISRHV